MTTRAVQFSMISRKSGTRLSDRIQEIAIRTLQNSLNSSKRRTIFTCRKGHLLQRIPSKIRTSSILTDFTICSLPNFPNGVRTIITSKTSRSSRITDSINRSQRKCMMHISRSYRQLIHQSTILRSMHSSISISEVRLSISTMLQISLLRKSLINSRSNSLIFSMRNILGIFSSTYTMLVATEMEVMFVLISFQ